MSKSVGNAEDKDAIVLQLYLHCQNCSKSVIKYLKHFPGVDEVTTDVENNRVTVKRKGVDPKSIAERLEKKYNKKVEIISPKPQQISKDVKIDKADTVKDEVKVVQVVLHVYIHCQNCGNNFRDRLLKMKGVRKVEVDKVKSQVKVEGVFEENLLVEYVEQRMGKKASIISTSKPEQVNSTPRKKQLRKKTSVEDDEDAPRIIHATSDYCGDLFDPPAFDDFFYTSQLLSDEYTQQCSVM